MPRNDEPWEEALRARAEGLNEHARPLVPAHPWEPSLSQPLGFIARSLVRSSGRQLVTQSPARLCLERRRLRWPSCAAKPSGPCSPVRPAQHLPHAEVSYSRRVRALVGRLKCNHMGGGAFSPDEENTLPSMEDVTSRSSALTPPRPESCKGPRRQCMSGTTRLVMSVRNELPYATPTVGDCCYSLYHAVETISGPRKSPTAKGKAEQRIYGVITN